MTVINKPITSEILVAYAQCPRKAYLLLCTGEKGTPHEYGRIFEQKKQANQRKYLDILRQKNPDVRPYSLENLTNKHEILINATLETNSLTAECAILSKVKTHSALGRYSYEPTIFVGTHSLNKEQKLELLFVGHVLGLLQNKHPASGQIIGLDGKPYKVKLENSAKTLIPLLEPLQEWAADSNPEPSPLILNKHCPTCQFQSLCRAKAEQEDNLSLLDGISTPKAINQYKKKGLFTVKQLSYTFRPRKRKKRAKNPPPASHKPELQALAIREGKIYLQELPQLTRQPVELFLDIEGVPDQQLYYLIGLLVCESNITTYHAFWADTPNDEAQMWQQFLAQTDQYSNALIYHYGSFEPRALAQLAKRYNTGDNSLAKRMININKHIFGKVYFPVYSNRLKEIGAYIGATWTSPNASGLQSLVWRHHWDETRNTEYKSLLLVYNQEDCWALKLLTDELSKMENKASLISELDFGDRHKRYSTNIDNPLHHQLETILEFAHANYDQKKINFQHSQTEQANGKKKRGGQKGRQIYRRIVPKTNKFIRVSSRSECPKHKGKELRPTKQTVERIMIDLVFTEEGVRKVTVKYTGTMGYCKECRHYYSPPEFDNLGHHTFGHKFQAWVIYQRLFLRLPHRIIVQALEDQFNERVSVSTVINFQEYFAHYYSDTEQILIQRILTSPFVHVDETKINIFGVTQYVWVFTDGKHVIFKLGETREATIAYEFFVDYKGIVISDFYPGYDTIGPKQQKCWVHLIRDLNDDLWKTPFDIEFETFVLEVRDLIVPIMEAVQKYDLKKRHLNKFKKPVDEFYKKVIVNKYYKSELVLKYQKRFAKYRNSLFTFLEYDNIPWHNNTAERAIRHLSIQRKISAPFFETGARRYLLLLGIMQTCKFQNKSFLKFLLSGEKDVDQYKQTKRKKNTKPVGECKKTAM